MSANLTHAVTFKIMTFSYKLRDYDTRHSEAESVHKFENACAQSFE